MFIGQSVSDPKPPTAPAPKNTDRGARVAVVLNIAAVLSLFAGGAVLLASKSAIHEIEAGIGFLCFICALSGAGIINALRSR